MNPYATDKLGAHLDVLDKLRRTGEGSLITVQLMPQNVCNHACSFCSYRMPENKNSDQFDTGRYLPIEALGSLADDFHALGVLGVEITGGGEPLAHPNVNEMLELMRPFQVALVTNGTLYERVHGGFAQAVGKNMLWVRISIDAACKETHSSMRRAPESHFDRAWQTVRQIDAEREYLSPDFRLGVAFTLNHDNSDEILPFCEMARESGADNVRLSLTFSDQNLDYFDADKLARALDDSVAAEELSTDTFRVHNCIPTRHRDMQIPRQDYRRCPSKDVLCVVEGSGKVHTCCTFTGSDRGIYGNFMEHEGGFKGLWNDNRERRKLWDCRKECQVACLYRDRNQTMNTMIDAKVMHPEFI